MARLFCAFLMMFIVSAARGADLPKYNLPAGRVLSYSNQSKSKEEGGRETVSSGTIRLIVARQNPDGSSHVILRNTSKYGDSEERTRLGYMDISADGRVKDDPTQYTLGRPLPALPTSEAELKSQWQSTNPFGNAVTTCKPVSDSGSELVFTAAEESAMNRIYVTTSKQTIHFDCAKGIVTGSESEDSQDYGFHSKGTGTMKLDKDETLEPEKLAAVVKDYDLLFDAQKQYAEQMARVSEEPAEAQKISENARATLDQGSKAVSTPEVKNELSRMLKDHDQYAKYEIDSAKKQADVLNEPAKWTASAKDLDGKEWSMSDLKGKVVVMDFWYRGCGWCMYAMPQVKQLAADYKDKPVVVLGMNTDQKEEDAKVVVKEMGLAYPQLKATGVPEKFGVEGFPTLIVIDQQGVVRKIHVGYSPDLHEKISKKVNELLKSAG